MSREARPAVPLGSSMESVSTSCLTKRSRQREMDKKIEREFAPRVDGALLDEDPLRVGWGGPYFS